MLENLLNTKLKKKLLNILFAARKRSFTLPELHHLADASKRTTSQALKELVKAGAVEMKSHRRHRYFGINSYFSLYQELSDLVDEKAEVPDAVVKLLKKVPNAKLIILSGALTFEPQLPVDVLVVGEDIGRSRLQKILAEIEKITALEINFAIMTEKEYEYRCMMNDRFIRDILDNQHYIILDLQKTHRRS